VLAPSTEGSRTYDLCINVAGRQLYWRNRNRGLTLGQNAIAWTMDGEANESAYGNVAAVHLDSVGQKVTTDRCTITFSDGRALRIVNTDPGGYADGERAALYRDFVHDLHSRLPADRCPDIRFTEGWRLWQCQAMVALAALIALTSTALGLYVLLCLGNARGLLLVALAAYASWTLYRKALNNLPREYTPDRLPEFLLS
jgi:hypothetical protein